MGDFDKCFFDFWKSKNQRKNANIGKRRKTPPKEWYKEAVYQISEPYDIWKVFKIDLQKALEDEEEEDEDEGRIRICWPK